jgi:hypothetical protein
MFNCSITHKKGNLTYSIYRESRTSYIKGMKEYLKRCKELNIKWQQIEKAETENKNSIVYVVQDNEGFLFKIEFVKVTLEVAEMCKKQAYDNYLYEEAAERDYDITSSREAFREYCEWQKVIDNLKTAI